MIFQVRAGQVLKLFEEIDVDNKGFITLKVRISHVPQCQQDLDPSVSKMMKHFFRCVQEIF